MTPQKKNEWQQVIKKAHEITPPPALSKKSYTAEEVREIITTDRYDVEVFYARYLQKI